MTTSTPKAAEAQGAKLAAVPISTEAAKPVPLKPAQPTPPRFRVAPPAKPARFRRRHVALMGTFLLMVVLPAALAGWYLWTRAADQYASYAGFSVRSEGGTAGAPLIEGLLGGPLGGGGGATSDPDILYEFLTSQTLVAEIDAELDLVGLWSRPREQDPVFSYDPDGTIEDLRDHWDRMVQISYDSNGGLIDMRVLAFDAAEATLIAQTVLEKSSDMINALADTARADVTAYAREDLEEAETRLKAAREAVTRFRQENRMVDPTADVQTQAGLLATLEGQLVEAMIELDLLRDSAGEADPRVQNLQRRVAAIEARMEEERDRTGPANPTGDARAMADVVGEFERLTVEREFAERTYLSALSVFEAARAEAGRKSRYLATHVTPTTAETPRYPRRAMLLSLVVGFAFLAWAVLVMVGYSLRDRR